MIYRKWLSLIVEVSLCDINSATSSPSESSDSLEGYNTFFLSPPTFSAAFALNSETVLVNSCSSILSSRLKGAAPIPLQFDEILSCKNWYEKEIL